MLCSPQSPTLLLLLHFLFFSVASQVTGDGQYYYPCPCQQFFYHQHSTSPLQVREEPLKPSCNNMILPLLKNCTSRGQDLKLETLDTLPRIICVKVFFNNECGEYVKSIVQQYFPTFAKRKID